MTQNLHRSLIIGVARRLLLLWNCVVTTTPSIIVKFNTKQMFLHQVKYLVYLTCCQILYGTLDKRLWCPDEEPIFPYGLSQNYVKETTNFVLKPLLSRRATHFHVLALEDYILVKTQNLHRSRSFIIGVARRLLVLQYLLQRHLSSFVGNVKQYAWAEG